MGTMVPKRKGKLNVLKSLSFNAALKKYHEHAL